MQANDSWIAMFRRIPANLQDTLSLGLTTGAEIVVQKIIKLEPDFMIVRGRVAGTQDTGRIALIPYAELTYVAIQRFLKDPEVEAIFGKGGPATAADMVLSSVEDAPLGESTPEAPAAEDATVNDPPPAVNPAKKPESTSKTALLAKLRERLKDGGPAGK
jgi:hypothetical protein